MNRSIVVKVLKQSEIAEEIYKYFKSMPDYQEVNHAYNTMLGQVKEKLGTEFCDQMEDRIITYWSLQSYAHYLFGLGLRQEILGAFMEI